MAKEYFTVATFRASSGRKWWRVCRDEAGNLSCTCPGWCRRVAKDGSRTCKHVRKVLEQGQVQFASGIVRRGLERRRATPDKLGRRRFRM